jgi:hypothetical protein
MGTLLSAVSKTFQNLVVQSSSKVEEMGTWVDGMWDLIKMEDEFVCLGG